MLDSLFLLAHRTGVTCKYGRRDAMIARIWKASRDVAATVVGYNQNALRL